MAFPKPAFAIPREIGSGTSKLPSKPGATIHYTFARGSPTPHCLVVFLNGLMADKASWLAVMANLIRSPRAVSYGIPSMLAYDRFGQGVTEDRDPLELGREKGHGHDVADAAVDLHELISQISSERLLSMSSQLRIVFVANSIGCAIARLYAQQRPGIVVGLLLLDSIMANSNFDWWPNPDLDGFNPEVDLPADVSVEVLREQRARFASSFHPDVANREGLSRRNLAQLLPHSDSPRLVGFDGRGPWVTVVGHDFEKFAEESLKIMGTPTSLSMQYTNPIWHKYNAGLAKITDPERSRGPIFAKGCGHFIQRDDPDFVVEELFSLLGKIESNL